ncbi:MAG TPA: hypothetical protein VMW31_00215 [Devosiaceae bacterium]|nr:hypothetical protein [Devosiaceae bacterium]
MKSLSTAAATDSRAGRSAVSPHDPSAGFTNVQWFLYSARNTIYFTAFLSVPFDRERLLKTAAQLVELAPQLKTGYAGSRPDEPLTEAQWDAVTNLEEVESLDTYPNAWLQSGEEVYDTPGLPLFRFKAVTRSGGPDAQGRASMVMVIASHALMEGSDSAILARSRDSSHQSGASVENPLPLVERVKVGLIAGLTGIGHLFAGHLFAPPKMQMAFDGQAYPRQDIRAVANRLGVSQRAVMYGVVMYALNRDRKRRVSALYTILGGARRDVDDDFIRARGIHARFRLADLSLENFIREVDAGMKRYEARTEGADQYVLNVLYGLHRRVRKVLPFLYTRRFFRFPGMYDIVLTMTPPHRIVGSFMEGVMEPIYAGSFHEGTSLITFVPSRKQLTINYTVPPGLAARAAEVPVLIDALAAG